MSILDNEGHDPQGLVLRRTDASDLARLEAENERLVSACKDKTTLLRSAYSQIERLRAALEVIAGSSTDKLQAIQAKAALDNVGAHVQQQATEPK